jgi:arylsulfatase A-like enzyme
MNAKPNVIIIMTDQQRADHCAREGFPLDTTPFLDSLAQEGVWFNRAYTSMPVCAPARVSMLTGRYPGAARVRTNHNIEDATYTQDLFDLFRTADYAAALIGKNHSHLGPLKADYWYEAGHLGVFCDDLTTQEREFDAFLKSTHFHLSAEPTPFPIECQIPFRLVSEASEWIASIGDQPFLLWLSFPEPHNPYQVPEPYYSLFPPDELPPTTADESALAAKGFKFQWCRQSFITAFPEYVDQVGRARANYLGVLRLIDDQVRRLVTFLEAQGVRENTIIVFLSDHGDFVGEYGLLRKGPELPEALTRIPLQFVGPGIGPSKAPHPAHVSIVDVLPTLCEAVGIPQPEGVQGRSLWPLLTGQDYPPEEFVCAYVEQGFGGLHYTNDEPLDPAEDGLHPGQSFDCLNSWTQSGTMRMLRKGDWKLIFDMQGAGQLYNLAEDPAELNNLYESAKAGAVRNELLADLLAWTLRAHDPLPLPRKRYVMKNDARNYWSPYRAAGD